MNGTPKDLNLKEVTSEIESIKGVKGIHYLHVWSMGEQSIALTCHVVVPDQKISATEDLRQTIHTRLNNKFGINHPVLQIETKACGQGTLLCQT